MVESLKELGYQVLFFAVLVSVVVDGLKKAIKIATDKGSDEPMSKWLVLGLIFGVGGLFGFMAQGDQVPHLWQKLLIGIAISTTSLTIYQSVIQAVLNLVPNLTEKIFTKKDDSGTK